MIVVKVELHSALTGKVTEIGRMTISNVGLSKDKKLGDYAVKLMRRGSTTTVQKVGQVLQHRRLAESIWSLVSKSLQSVGF